MDTTLSKTQKWLIAIFSCIIALGCAVRLVMASEWYEARTARDTALAVSHEKSVGTLLVDVDGAVMEPGVYQLPEGSTHGDAILLAGGRTRSADTRCVNLTSPARDKEKIYIPHKSENACANQTQTEHNKINPKSTGSNSGYTPNDEGTFGGNHVININTATAVEFDTLPGIGPTYARRIVELREQRGRFATIEEIMLVNGIGKSTFEKINNRIITGD